MVEGFDMSFGFCLCGLLHSASVHKDRHSAVQDIYLLMGIIDHSPGSPYTAQGDSDASHKEEDAQYHYELNLIL